MVVDRTIGAIRIAGCTIRFAELDGDGTMNLEEFKRQGGSEALFHSVDRDRSGDVTKSEFRAFIANAGATHRVRSIETGADGAAAAAGGGGAALPPHHATWLQSLEGGHAAEACGTLYCQGMAFRFVDLDGDGHMDLDEARPQGMTKSIFKTIDTSGDGLIDMSEFKR